MKLLLIRTFIGSDYTIGQLNIDNTYFCETLEDVPRKVKIANKTCIPTGIYKVILNFSNRFQKIMPLLLNVPGFDVIMIHPGNTSANTSGCILVGKNTKKGELTESRITYNALLEKMKQADEIWIEVV